MATVQEQLKLKRVPIDKWCTREQLCLASSVLRSGDQNWMSVSRSVKVFGEPNRPDDWFSQKNCAVQYSTMLEKAETPKRKKRSGSSDKDGPVETAGEIILRKYTNEHMEELKAILEMERAGYLKVQKELSQIEKGEATAEQIAEWTLEMENEKKQKEIDAQNHSLWLKERERKKAQLERAWKPHLTPNSRRKMGSIPESPGSQTDGSKDMDSTIDSSIGSLFNVDVLSDDSTEPKVLSPAPTSPFLTSLLKNPPPSKIPAPTSILHSAITSQRATPTITSLLSSSPGVPLAPGGSGTKMAAVGSDDMAAAGVPTLSMLLQIPPGGSEKMATGIDSFTGSGIGPFGHLSSDAMHHPQQEELQLCKGAETDEILDVVDVEQSLVEDMEPIEIGLEEIIADLEQAANQDAMAAAAGGKGQLLEESIVLEDIPETPTNVDTFHKIFDDFYAMNVVKPKADPEEMSTEGKAAEGGTTETSVGVALNVAASGHEEKPFVVSEFDVTREELNAELDNAVAYVEERSAEKSVAIEKEEVKMGLSTSDIFDSLLSAQPPIASGKIAEREIDYADVVMAAVKVVEEKAMPGVPEDVSVLDVTSVLPVSEEKDRTGAVEVVVPEPIKEPAEIKVETKAPPEIVRSTSVESEPVTRPTRQSVERMKEKMTPVKAAVDDMVVQKKPSKYHEKSDEKVSKKAKPKERVDLGEDETSRKDISSILKTELLKHPEKEVEETEVEPAVEKVKEAISAKADDIIEATPEVETSDDESKTEKAESVPSEKASAVEQVEEADESAKEGDDKPVDSQADSMKAGDYSDSGVASGEVSSQDKSLSEMGTPKSEINIVDFPSSSRSRLMRRTVTPAIDSLPGSPASHFTDEEKEHRAWKKAIMLVWNGLAAHKYASIFCRPITDDIAPLYSVKVKRPIDLNMIKRNIETGVIRTTAEFQCNVMMMFLNACMYNKTKGDYFTSALEMQKDCLQQIQDFIATQKLIQSPGDSAATRRETRTTAEATSIGKRKRESDAGKNPIKKRKV